MQIDPGYTARPAVSENVSQGTSGRKILSGDLSRGEGFKQVLARTTGLKDADGVSDAGIPPSRLDTPLKEAGGASDRILVGTVTQKVPTVSELLYTTSYKNECWNILAERVNAGKSFTTIPPGTEIFIDPETCELSWDTAGEKKGTIGKTEASPGAETKTEAAGSPVPADDTSADDTSADAPGVSQLSAAARKFLGTAYSKMDCYELVVGGLKGMGIQYQGKDGLGGHLIERAVNKGFAYNHYLTGEGITDAAGTKPYSRRVFKIKNADMEADRTMAEMTPFLKDGQILSFSTRTRGHTGIVSKQDNVWTFINSGTMDHNLAGGNGRKGVGEEGLAAEVRNWFQLAAGRGEGLTVSLGAIDLEKLAKFSSSPGGFTEKV